MIETRDLTEIGKKYYVTHGVGTFLGYEAFDMYGNQAELTDRPNRSDSRRAFKLDDGHSWAFTNIIYYAYVSDVIGEYDG